MAVSQKTFYSGPDVEVDLGQPVGTLSDVKSVSGGALTVEAEKVWGTGNKPKGYTTGVYNVDNLSIEVGLGEYFNMIEAVGGDYTTLVNEIFDISILFSAPGEPVQEILYTQCRLINDGGGVEVSMGESTAASTTLEFQCLGKKYNGSDWLNLDVEFGLDLFQG